MGRLSTLDYAFLALETAASPKHVAGLQVFDLPENAAPGFLDGLYETFRSSQPVAPFDQKLKHSLGLPTWVEDKAIDLDYHVRRCVLPAPGSRSQLVELVAELHEERLDRTRPLWQFHLIEGVKGGKRFAAYLKIHHAYMDGAKVSARVTRVLSESPDDLEIAPFWSAHRSARSESPKKRSLMQKLQGGVHQLGQGAVTAVQLGLLNVGHLFQALHMIKGGLPLPFSAPKSLINQPLTPPRSVAAVDLPLPLVRGVAKANKVKVNDVILEVCDSALRRYLSERGEAIEEPLIAQVPIALEQAQANQVGNQITIALLELATTEPDPSLRLQEISNNATTVKQKFSKVTPSTAQTYTVFWQTIAEVFNMVGLTGRARPLGNVLVSNLPGPKKRLYLRGAPVIGIYPISAIPPGMTLNITIYTYANMMHFGMIAGREAIPDLERLAEYIEAGLRELEAKAQARPEPAPPMGHA
jgi:WS/DGAT/MGAT family acyltransferase